MSKNWTPDEVQAASAAMAAAGQPTYEEFTAKISAEATRPGGYEGTTL